LVLTTFISSSPGLAMPSTLVPDRLSASSRRVPSREARPSGLGEDTLSQELRTVGLLRPHVLVGYQWSHTGFCPGSKASHNKYIRSFVSQSPQNGTGAISTHAAQALNNVPARYDRVRFHRPTTPPPRRGCPIGLGVNLDVTVPVPVTEMSVAVAGAA